MRRRVDGEWIHETLGPGDVSLLTRAAESHWVWPADIEVVHVYLTQDELANTCRQMYERDVQDVELHDVVKADDPAIHRTAMLMAHEAAQGAAGSRLMVDSLSCQLVRAHPASARRRPVPRKPPALNGLSFGQERTVRAYVDQHLQKSISLEDLACTVGLSRYHFARRFRQSTGTTPHEFVLRQRVERAKTLLHRTNTPLPDIACSCGFADQSHMTREFRKRVGLTPGRYRARSR